MDIKLPNGVVIKGVPEGTSKDAVKQKAIAAGLAKPEDFGDVASATADIPLYDDQNNPIEADNPGAIKSEQASALNFLAPAEAIAAIGTGALSSLQGAATGLVDSFTSGAFLEGKGPEMVQQSIQDYTQAGTYQPRTPLGKEVVGAIGKVGENLPPVIAGFSPAQMAIAGQSARAASQVAPTVVRGAAQSVAQALPQMPQQGSARSIGAAEVPQEVVQYMKFQELPVPVTPTMSDLATGDARFAWKQFENEIAKDEQLGKANRDAAATKNSQIQQNFESFIDMTGSDLPETNYQYATGNKVVDALYKGMESDRAKVSAAYKAADEKGELQGLVPQDRLDGISSFVNENRAKRTNAPVLQGFVDEAFVKEVGEGSLADGTFRLKPMNIKQAEQMRQEIGRLTDGANGQDMYYAGQLKKLIDDAQEGLGGSAFKVARKLAKQTFDKYENAQIIDMLLSEKKGYTDAKVAPELVVQKAVLSGSVDDLRKFRSTLMKSGADGMSAWRDVQSAVLRTIRDEATKGKSVVDNAGLIKAQAGAINKAIANLNQNGKLDLLFGKKDADKLRLLGDVSSRIAEQMTGTFNSSNNMAWISVLRKIPVIGGATDMLGDAISIVKNRKLNNKAKEAVNFEETLKKQGIDLKEYKDKPQK